MRRFSLDITPVEQYRGRFYGLHRLALLIALICFWWYPNVYQAALGRYDIFSPIKHHHYEKKENYFGKINEVAEANWMIAYVSNVGFKEPVIKVCPENQENTPLLVLRDQGGLYLLRHKTEALTDQYRGRKVSLEWVIGFIKANRDEKNKETRVRSTHYSGDMAETDNWREWKK